MKYYKTEKGKKNILFTKWKNRGLIGNYEEIYKRYLDINQCELCNIELCQGQKSNGKCMDHNHETGEFRNVVCRKCNVSKSDRMKSKSNTSGYKNLGYHKTRKQWFYKKKIKGKTICIWRKNKIEILCIKFCGILLYKY